MSSTFPSFAPPARLLLVELADSDAAAVAARPTLAHRLQRLGCTLAGVASTAAQALALAAEGRCDLAVVDLRRGPADGAAAVAVAQQLQRERGVAVLFCGGAPDGLALERALAAGPLGWLPHPCGDAELHAALRIALQRAAVERDLRDARRAHHTILAGIREGVVAVDTSLAVRYINAQAEALTGWKLAEARGRPLHEVLSLRDEADGRVLPAQSLAQPPTPAAQWNGRACLVLDRAGQGTPVEVSTAAISEPGQAIGWAITLHGLAERRRADGRFRALLESAPDAMVIVDAEGRIVLVNSQAERMFGHGRTSMLGEPVEMLLPPRLREAHAGHRAGFFAAAHVRAMGAGIELLGRRADGSEFPVEISLSPLETDEGMFVSAAIRDATERTEARRRLRESEERFRSLSALSSDWYWEQDSELRFVAFSGGHTDATGSRAGSLMGQRRWDVPALNLGEAEWAAHRALLEAHRPFRDFVIQRAEPDGSSHWVSISGEPMFDAAGRFTGYHGVGRDITERMRDAQVIEDSLATMRATLESTTDGIVVVDTRRGAVHANRRFLDIWGLPELRLEQREAHRRHMLAQAVDPERMLADLRRLDVAPELEHTDLLELKNGRVYEAHSRPLVTAAGISGRVWSLRDVTEQRRAAAALVESEASLKRFVEQLEQRVVERTAELAAARDEAERLARVKSEFLANMSHEIRTPLHAVLGLAGIGLRESAGRPSEPTFQRILDSGEHLLGVINTILDISKLEAGKQQAEQRPFRLADVVGQAEEFVALAAQRKGLTCSVTLERTLPAWVRGDALRLQQILVNLLGNAVKFTDRGGVRLAVRGDGERVCFEVSDTGIGIEPAQIGKLFTPFEQLDKSTTRRFGGTGLGLMLSQSLAALMGGAITVLSTPGQGSTFTLTLQLPPAAPAEAATRDGEVTAETGDAAATTHGAGADDLPPEGQRLRGLRVLAVDDVDINRMILEDLLAHEGARARVVDGAAAALQSLAEAGPQGFDVVLMDIQMPQMDGYEAARRIHALAPRLPIIGLTAHALAEERERCLAAGMVEHVSKPVDVKVLVRAMRRHVRRSAVAANDAPRNADETQRPAAAAAAPGEGAAAAPAPSLVDWKALRARYASLPGFVDKLAAKALATQERLPGQLRLAAKAGDLAAMRALAHDTASLAGHLEAPALRELAREAEQSFVDWRGPELALELAGRLAEGVEGLLRELQQREAA